MEVVVLEVQVRNVEYVEPPNTRDHSYNSQVSLIMDNFNWNGVMSVFRLQQLTYYRFNGDSDSLLEEYEPSLNDVTYLVKELFQSVRQGGLNESCSVSSGLFTARWDSHEELLSLEFTPYSLEVRHDEPNESIFVV